MDDPYNLQRFADAQEPVIEGVFAELQNGRKASHWMWFIFPQIAGLGRSSMARLYAITSLDEARAYLKHPVLGPRLRECTRLVNEIESRSAREIFGAPDYLKFHSSMTLFSAAAPDEGQFPQALAKFFNAQLDELTIAAIGRDQ